MKADADALNRLQTVTNIIPLLARSDELDDTAATILALVKHDPKQAHSPTVIRAVTWILGMQNPDGGWAAFDKYNDKLWLNKIPLSDMDALCDPSTSDITGRVLEAFGLILDLCKDSSTCQLPLDAMYLACEHGIAFLALHQEAHGAWWGRWGCNYIYGTSAVLCGLESFSSTRDDVRDMVDAGVSWVKSIQNEDGGWGEDLISYWDRRLAEKGASTPSQTAWALTNLLPYCGGDDDEAMTKGISYLLRTQVAAINTNGIGSSWPEEQYTGTGFPNHFYFGYDMYRHDFPMMALGRYLRLHEDDRVSVDWCCRTVM